MAKHKKIVKSEKISSKFKEEVNAQPIYLGRHDLETLHFQDSIQSEVEEHWRPPVGLSKDLSCCVKVRVGWNGSIGHVKVEKSSGVLVYDISARMAVYKLKMPQMAKGKEINITFNQ